MWPIKSSFRFSIRRREKKEELVVLSAVSLREAKCATLYAKVAIHDFVKWSFSHMEKNRMRER